MAQSNLIEELKSEILNLDLARKEQAVGEIAEIGDGIVRIFGLKDAKSGELLKISSSKHDVMAMALNLEESVVGAIVLGEYSEIKAGD
jgi:F-type H+-transporting ATPase subunit alpha